METDTLDPPTAEVDDTESRHGRALGLNVSPGVDDDGWTPPPPVRLRDGTTVRLHKDGEALKAAYDAVAAARSFVLLEVYIFSTDETGRAFADLLSRKAREGVGVWLMFDGFGSWTADRGVISGMRQAGVRIAEFHPMRPTRNRFGWQPWTRDHRKLLVVDGVVGWLGGMNIGTEYGGPWVALTRRKPQEFWRDNAISLTGPAVRHLHVTFLRAWRYARRGGRIRRTMYVHNLDLQAPRKGKRLGKQRMDPRRLTRHRGDGDGPGPSPLRRLDDDFGLLASAPTLASPLRPFLHDLLGRAQKSIQLTMGYFAPDDLLIEELCDAARRGVRVELMLSGETDVKVMLIAARAFYPRLVDAGIKVYERQGVNLHAKIANIDDRYSVIGSTNLDHRSIEINLEVSAIVRCDELGRQVRDLFENDVRFSVPIDGTRHAEHHLWDRFVMWLVTRMRYLL